MSTCEPLDPDAALAALITRKVPAEAPVADGNGNFEITLAPPPTIDPYGPDEDGGSVGSIDCGARAGRCSVVITAAADTRRSAVWPYTLQAE